MIDTLTASIILNRMIRKAQALMWRRGFLSPLVCAIGEGTPVPFLFKHPAVLVTDSDVDPDADTGMYRTIAMIQVRTPEEQKHIEEVTKLVACKTKADVIGIVVACFYKRYHGDRPASLELDPEAVTLLHSCFYMKGNKKPFVMQVPYIHRGETASVEDTEIKYDINYISTPWGNADAVSPPKIPYPFED